MSSHHFELLPPDILLYVFEYCNLATHTVLPLVCTRFNDLAQERGYWIKALQKALLYKPIACPLHADLARSSLARLRQIAFHTLRLERNWSSPSPAVRGIVHKIPLGREYPDVIFQVPGRDFYLMHSRETGRIAAWNIKLGKRVTPEYYMANYVRDVSPGQDEPGCFSMGLLTAEDMVDAAMNKLFVISLEYDEDDDEVVLDIKFIAQFEPKRAQWGAFMTKEIVGVLDVSYSNDDPEVHILAYNMRNKRSVNIVTDLMRKDIITGHGQSATCMTKGDLLILVESEAKSFVYTCPGRLLPHDCNAACKDTPTVKLKDTSVIKDWSPAADAQHRIHSEGCLSSDDLHGVPAVSINRYVRQSDDAIAGLQVRFWSPPRTPEYPWSTLVPAHIVDVPGHLHESPWASWSLLLIPCSGLRVLLILNSDDRVSLKLISYHPETNESTVSELDVSPYFDIRGVYNIAMDDHRGILSLLHCSGDLYTVPYA